MPADRANIAQPPRASRSAVANGTRLWVDSIDGRSAPARRFRDVLGDLVEHLGGEAWISEPQRHLARRAAALVVSCEKAEMALVNGDDFDIQGYATASNSLRRLLTDLGLRRHARDVTPDPLVNGSEAIKVEHTHHVVEQADSFTSKLIDLAATAAASSWLLPTTANSFCCTLWSNSPATL